MSVFRVITRIIPLDSTETSFQPVPFSLLTDGISREIKVLNLTEPQTGMNYRIERIEDIQNVGPGESIESVNKAFSEKLKSIPGFVQLKASDAQLNPYSKSFKLTLPQIVSLNCNDDSSHKNTNSLTISVVKNCNYNKVISPSKKSKCSVKINKKRKNDIYGDIKSPKSKSIGKKLKYTVAANRSERNEAKINLVLKKTKAFDTVYENGKSDISNDIKLSKGIFKSKYPMYLSKRLKKSTALRNRNKSPKVLTKSPKPLKLKLKKSDISYFNQYNGNQSSKSQNFSPTVSEAEANSDTDTVQDLDTRASEQQQQSEIKINDCTLDAEKIKTADKPIDIDKEKTDSIDDFLYDFESGDLVINEPETTDSTSDGQQDEVSDDKCDESPVHSGSLNLDKSPSDATRVINGAITENSGTDDSFANTSQNDSSLALENNTSDYVSNDSSACNKFLVPADHPLYDILQPLKKYFVNSECIICGFICTDIDYDASMHMESHIFVDSSPSSYKCHCCDEKFSSPRTLYKHALSREKSYKYMCNICLLKFKRQHYLMRHSAKAHSVIQK